jgi:hypothetical protein
MIVTPGAPPLVESKAVGKHDFNIQRDVVLLNATRQGVKFQRSHAAAHDAAREKLDGVLEAAYERGVSYIEKYLQNRISFEELQRGVRSSLWQGYNRSFELGMRSTGASKILAAHPPLYAITHADRAWLNSAFQTELRFLNGFLDDIRKGRLPATQLPISPQGKLITTPGNQPVTILPHREIPPAWLRRYGMYIAAIGSVFYSGRVMVTPPNHVIFWLAKLDGKTCPQCRYMARNSPYTKYNLPITPASGFTRCLGNCRCRIQLQEVNTEYFTELVSHSVTRETHMRKLKTAV